MIRATTGGVMRTYRSNLMGSFINMNASRNTVLSQRNFNSYAEDPAAAARAFRLRKSRMTVKSQYDICVDTMKKYESAVACLQSVDDVLCTKDGVYGESMNTIKGTQLKALNDPTGDARTQLMKALDQMSQSIIQTMNQKYGDNFIFAGADGHNVPFQIIDNRLYYRGIPVDATLPNVLSNKNGDTPIAVSEDGQIIDGPVAGQVFYLNMDRVKKITKEEYERLYVLPELEAGDPPTEYNKDGTTPYDPDADDGGPYYKLAEQDAEGNDQYISKDKYEQIQERLENTRFLSKDDGTGTGETVPVTVDKDGNVVDDGSGDYYVIFDPSQLMDKEDYDEEKMMADKLDYLANEKYFVDIGLGFQEDDRGKLIESSGYNAALNGIKFLGYGLDEEGDPKNLYSLVQKMKDIATNIPEEGKWDSETYDRFYRLVQKFEDGVSNYQTEYVNLDASTAKLKNQEALLSDNFYNLQEQYSDLEDVDMVDAITSFIWAEYCYNAALKVGNSILGQSLMDYLS